MVRKIDTKKPVYTTDNKKSVTMSSKRSGSKTSNPRLKKTVKAKVTNNVKTTKTTKTAKTTVITPVKRRGRRPKKILSEEDLQTEYNEYTTEKSGASAVIVRLPFHPTKGSRSKITGLTKNKQTKAIVSDSIDGNSSDDSDILSEGMFCNDIPGDNKCQRCEKNEKTITTLRNRLCRYEKKNQDDKNGKVYVNKLNLICHQNKKKIKIRKTNIRCWWDGHTFNNYPCFLPELFYNDTYHVIGCFCSFNCALAYNLYYMKDSKTHHRKSLVYKLYREMFDLSSDEIVELQEAPPKEILEEYGGTMSIETFRRNFIETSKEYLRYIPPIRPINILVEEKSVAIDDDLENDYVLRRTRPIIKKASIIESMNIKIPH